jgi:biotin carboxylase
MRGAQVRPDRESQRGLVLLTFGSARQSRDLAAAARRAGYCTKIAHVNEHVTDWVPRSVSEILADSRKALQAMNRPPDAMINLGRATVPDGIRRIAKVQEELRGNADVPGQTALIGPSESAARVWGDKSLIARSLARMRLPMPATAEVSAESVGQVTAQVRAGWMSLPLVVKAVHLTGGMGMRYVGEIGELPGVVHELSANGSRLVASEFVDGDEVSVDLLRLGKQVLVYPPGFKRHTDRGLTHADHKVKVNGIVRTIESYERDIVRIAKHFDLCGFFSLEGVITGTGPPRWKILEGATRITNNLQMQDASLAFDSLAALVRFLAGEPWLPSASEPRLALSVPIYDHRGTESLRALQVHPWVLQAKLEDLALMPGSSDNRVRLTVKMAVHDLNTQLKLLVEATGAPNIAGQVQQEVERVRKCYGA